ncbi:MAG: D-alanyl-D-alanine carboxypeptidase/D-alanyl-D-alanine-endopeptidase [Prevotellaceae bacterium]|nr:D-alanyl-D-alanine carboxypeptidase/D-alanyl-D-alanine-endopeptidase [Prevotellaceae bacterium]
MKNHVFLLAFLLFALTSNADDRRKRAVLLPDSAPPSLSIEETPQPIVYEETEDETSLDAEERAAQWGAYNLNSVPLASEHTWKGTAQRQLDSLCNTPLFATSQLGLYVFDITAGEDLFAVNYRHRMRPASCEKLVTAISALSLLGGGYQLLTDLRMAGEVRDGVLEGDVYVVGRMDPLLAQGDVYGMARELREQGIDSIAGTVNMDVSFKDTDDYGWGWCWDDKWGPLRVLTIDGRDTFAQEFLSDLHSVGIRLADEQVHTTLCPSSARLLRQSQHSVDQILPRMLKQSDNIFAESLFCHIAANGASGRGVGHRQAAARIKSFISQRLEMDASAYEIADGSGLSLYNYVSPQLLVEFLVYAWQNEQIRLHLYGALPVAASDGTLAKRMKGTEAQHNVHAKTGTVEGVSSLAGYATRPDGHILAFSIINQGISSTRAAKDFQDRVCQVLCQ